MKLFIASTRVRSQGWLSKLDYEKAYDRVNLDFFCLKF
jgi:hypothetical protein